MPMARTKVREACRAVAVVSAFYGKARVENFGGAVSVAERGGKSESNFLYRDGSRLMLRDGNALILRLN